MHGRERAMTGGACRLAPDAANQPADSAGITTFAEALGIGPPGLGLSSQPAVNRPMQNRRTKAVLLMRRMLCPLPRKSSRTPRRAARHRSGQAATGRSPPCSRRSMSSSTLGRSATLSIT